MKTTLNKIKEFEPCESGWRTLLKSLGKTKADNVEFDLMHILKSNDIKDAVWCLRCFDYLDYCLFLADVAESVLHIYEQHNKSKAPRDVIAAIHEYKLGNIDKSALREAADYAAHAAHAAHAADAATTHAAYAAAHAAYATYADATVDATAHAAAAHADYAVARKRAWDEIEVLFIKHFGGE